LDELGRCEIQSGLFYTDHSARERATARMTRSELKNPGVVELLLGLLRLEQNNEYFLRYRRSGRGHCSRRIFWAASLTNHPVGMPNGNGIQFDLIASGDRKLTAVQNCSHLVNAYIL